MIDDDDERALVKRFDVLEVMATPCKECLYSARRIVSLARAREIIAQCDETECGFSCHKATIMGRDVMCRSHWDRTKDHTVRNRLAVWLDVVRFVNEGEL